MTDRQKELAAAFSIFVLALGAFLVTTNQLFSFDSITNAIACESNEVIRWIHPNHPLYPLIGVAYFRLERLFGYHGFAIYSLARLNSILVAAALALIFHGLSKITQRKEAGVGILLLFSCYSVWHYAVDGRAVGASVFGAALVVHQLCTFEARGKISRRDVFLLAAASSLYVLLHAISVFHIAAVAWWLRKKEKLDGEAAGHSWIVYAALTISAIAVGYVVGYLLVGRSTSFVSWALGYAGQSKLGLEPSQKFWSKSASGIVFGLWHGWKESIAKDSYTSPHSWLTVGLAMIAIISVLDTLVRARTLPHLRKNLAWCFFVWGILVSAFLAFWSPGQEGFRLHVLVAWIPFVMIGRQWTERTLLLATLFASVCLSVNLSGAISYESNVQNNQGLQAMRAVRAHAQPGDLFLTALSGVAPNIEVLRPYFFPELAGGTLAGRLYAFNEHSLEPLSQSVLGQQKSGRAIFFADDLFDRDVQSSIEQRYRLKSGEISEFVARFDCRPELVLPSGHQVLRCRLR